MSSTFHEDLTAAIKRADNELIVDLIEARAKRSIVTESESLLCGVLLLMPPVADYEAAANIFEGLLPGIRGFEAAVWHAYRYAVLEPVGNSFQSVLRAHPGSGVAAHLRSMVANANNDVELAVAENQTSRALRLFPFNITEALRMDPDLTVGERHDIWAIGGDLIISKVAESDLPVSTVEGCLQRHWENLIVGTRMTSQLWDHYGKLFGSTG